MELWALSLVGLVIGVGIGLWAGARRGGLAGLSPDVERRLLDHVERIRAAVASEVREGSQSTQRAIADAGVQQTERLAAALAEARREQSAASEALAERVSTALSDARKEQGEQMAAARTELKQSLEGQCAQLTTLRVEITAGLEKMGEAQGKELRELTATVGSQLDAVRKDNEEKLEAIRVTVDEKLQTTLENRLGESFRQVSERLEKVHEGLGEMKSLAAGVGDLKKVLTNVKTRGVFGETQLASLLEEAFTSEQFDKNVETRPLSNQRVEFALKLPGRNGDASTVWLPIDAKFPLEDYQRLQLAYDAGNPADVDAARQGLRQRALAEAQSIQSKYIAPPHTTDFGLMFVPTEGLYAEILRIPGLHDTMMHEHHVVLVGPTTLHALLASLQMGFRTLAIEKRTSDVWRVLGAVKTEFASFGESLQAVNKKIQQAGSKIDEVARRSRAMQKKLRDVESLPEGDARVLLQEGTPVASTECAEQAELELVAG